MSPPKGIGYIDELRRLVGPRPLIVVCGCCAVIDPSEGLLLQQRSEPGLPWGLPGGSMELGESPSATAVRETKEETGLDVNPKGLLGIYTIRDHIYPSGDIVQSIDVAFLAEVTGGTPTADGVETTDVRYFPLDDLPTPIFAPHTPMLADIAARRYCAWD